MLIVIQAHQLPYPVSIDCSGSFNTDFKQVQVPREYRGIKRTVTVWKQQCIKCGETGYVIPIWYTRIWQSYLNAVPSKETTEKKTDILTRNLAGLHSMLQEKHRKSVTEMRALNYSGGREQGRRRGSKISIILFCSNTISLVWDTAVGMPWWVRQTALLWELLGLSYITLFYLFSSALSRAFENVWELFLTYIIFKEKS